MEEEEAEERDDDIENMEDEDESPEVEGNTNHSNKYIIIDYNHR